MDDTEHGVFTTRAPLRPNSIGLSIVNLKNFKKSIVLIKKLTHPNLIIIYLISLAHLTHDTYTSFLSPLLPLLIKKHGISLTYAAFLSVALRLPSLSNPFIGIISDKIGPKYFIIFPVTISGIAMCLLGNASNYIVIIVLLFITGISSAFFHVPAPVLIKNTTNKYLGSSMSSYQIGGELSRTIGPILVITTISWFGLTRIYYLIPIAIIVSVILLLKLKNNTNIQKDKIEEEISINLATLKRFLIEKKYLLLSITGLLLTKSFTASIIAAFLPTYLSMKGKGLWFSGGALSIFFASAMIGVLFTGILSDKFGRNNILKIFVFITPFAMLFFLFVQGNMIFLAIILLGFISCSTTPVVLAYVQESNFRFPSVANGIYMTMNFIFSSLSVLGFGKLSDLISIDKALFVFALGSFIGIPFIFFLPKINTNISNEQNE